jgi:hypothetical protein
LLLEKQWWMFAEELLEVDFSSHAQAPQLQILLA